MRVFADASAVVKLYADEAASAAVRSLEAMYVADITRVEVPAALWRKVRMGELDRGSCTRLVERFEDDLDLRSGRLVAATVDHACLRRAAELTGVHGLRAYDAVQLATALRMAELDPRCRTFATFDQDLAAAAQAEGFAIL